MTSWVLVRWFETEAVRSGPTGLVTSSERGRLRVTSFSGGWELLQRLIREYSLVLTDMFIFTFDTGQTGQVNIMESVHQNQHMVRIDVYN